MHKVSPMGDEITTREALEILHLAHPASITRDLVETGKLKPSRKLPGRSGAYLFWRHDIELLAAERASAPAKAGA